MRKGIWVLPKVNKFNQGLRDPFKRVGDRGPNVFYWVSNHKLGTGSIVQGGLLQGLGKEQVVKVIELLYVKNIFIKNIYCMIYNTQSPHFGGSKIFSLMLHVHNGLT